MAYEATAQALEELKSDIENLVSMMGGELAPSDEQSYEAGEGTVVDEYMGVKNGDIVTISDGRMGVVEHIMTGGTLGIPGSDFAIEATEENPGMTIRLLDGDVQTEFLLNIRFTDVSA